MNAARRVVIAIWLYAAAPGAALAADLPDESHVKAAFLYNFARFVEWPAGSFKSPSDPISICVSGDDAFSVVESAVQGKTLDARPIVVHRWPAPCFCQILFIAASERKRQRPVLEKLRGSATLTVGESSGFLDDGGIVNFKTVDGRVRIEINPAAAERARLHVSAKLLSLAELKK